MFDKILYAPWRKKYIENKKPKKCVFCNPSKDFLILKSKYTFLIANKFPYTQGHLLVTTKRHVNSIFDLTKNERIEIFDMIDLATYLLNIYSKPEGYNIGSSIGKVAGESIDHLHFHIIPRFSGDIGWNIGHFNVISVTPKDLVKDLKKIIKTQKLAKKFDILEK